MRDKIAKKILKMEKDELMSKSKFDRDWELITALDLAIEALEDRPQGKWIYGNLDYSTCSNCTYHNHYGDLPFCPNCGADMRGGRQ